MTDRTREPDVMFSQREMQNVVESYMSQGWPRNAAILEAERWKERSMSWRFLGLSSAKRIAAAKKAPVDKTGV